MISKFFIEHPIFANVIAIITIIVGFVAFFTLPVSQYPAIAPPTIQVSTRYPGASAEVVAATIGIPIEQAVNGIENALYMSSNSTSDGSYTLTITFKVGTNLNTQVALIVKNLVNAALAQLPAAVLPQGVNIRKVSTDILMVISLYSEDERYDEKFLSNYAVINMQNPLARIEGVSQVRIFGAGPYSMRVWLDPDKLHYYSLTTLDVLRAIQSQNVQVGAGQLGAPPVSPDQAFQFTINTLGRLSDVSQFEDIIVKSARGQTGQIVRLRDVSRVELSQQNFSTFSSVKGHKSSQIPIFALPDANAIDTAKNVREEVARMSRDFPPGLSYGIFYDTSRFVNQTIRDVYTTLFEAGILVLIVIMVFLQSWRAILVPATTIPVTIIGAFAAMAVLGFTINLMTLFALILSIGIVVDDAIIIVENASYHIEQGMAPKEATIQAMKEMTGPILGITLVLTSVFLPAAFLPGVTGRLFRQFALVIGSTAIISAVNALTLKPAQSALYLRPVKKKSNLFYRTFNKSYSAFENFYMKIVSWMAHRSAIMLIVYAVLILGTVIWFVSLPTGFLPVEDQGYAILVGRLPDAASQPRVRQVTEKVNEILGQTKGISAWVAIGGYSLLDGAAVPNMFTYFIIFEDWHDRRRELSQENILGGLRQKFAAIQEAGIFVLIPPSIRGLGQAGGFQIMIEDRKSLGLLELQRSVMEIIRAASAQPELVDLTSTFSARTPQLYLEIDRTKVESLNVPLNNVFETLQAYLGSSFVNLFNKFNQVFQVYIQAESRFRSQPQDIMNLYVRNAQDQMVPLGTLLEVKETTGAQLATRYNLYPAAAVFGSAAPGISTGRALELMEQIAQNTLPQGMSFDWTATAYQEKQIGLQAYFIYALCITLVYLVLAALYESWFSPAAVILTVPLALVGVLLGIVIRGYDNNLYTQVGLVLMIALASKNAILIVEYARELHASGQSIIDAAVSATHRRLRPIAMTSFAFILGVVPLLVASQAGAASQRAIGTVVFGGMLSSTLLAIPFVPVFFVITQKMSETRRRRGSSGR